jgi:hypothetical protein
MVACFGVDIAADGIERNHRFFEEATELVQACGMTASEAHQLVDYTFGRAIGEPTQEVGGVMVTLAALCLANGLDMHAAGETELARIWTKVDAIRAKQAAKPKPSPLPAAPAQSVGVSTAFKAWFESAWASYKDKAISGGKVVSMAWALKGYRAAPAQSGEPVRLPESDVAALYYSSAHDPLSGFTEKLNAALDRAAPPAQTAQALTDWEHRCAVLVDIYDDAMNNAPEDRSYIDGAFKAEIDEVRELLTVAQPASGGAK